MNVMKIEPKIHIDWNELKLSDKEQIIKLVNNSFDAGYGLGCQEGWVKHKKATDNDNRQNNQTKDVKVKITEIITETEKAICYLINNKENWIPRSQIIESNSNHIIISNWLASKRGLLS